MSELLNKEPVKRVEKSLKKFDPNLKIIVLDTTARTAKDAATGGSNSYDKFKSLEGVLEDKGVLMQQIKAEQEIANELEQLRTKGGRRAIPIPKQS